MGIIDRALGLGLACAGVCLAAPAAADDYPARPIRLVVGFAAGGPTDIFARVMGQHLAQRLGQQVIVENRPGGGGNTATEAVISAAPDGYTVLVVATANAINTSFYRKLPFDFMRDIVPVAGLARISYVMALHPSVPAKTVAEFISYAKANPGQINFASGGVGSSNHLAGELFKANTGINIVHVPYRGVGPGTQAIVAGDVQLMYNNIATALPHVEAGKLTALAVGGEQRFPALANVPTVAETVPGFDVTPWVGIFVPINTPKEIVARLSKEVESLLKDPEVVKIFQTSMIKASYLDSEPFTKQIAKETDDWEKVIKSLGIKAD
jgi:tripartite-type tricarboxylate transporter receptor subunit TctC